MSEKTRWLPSGRPGVQGTCVCPEKLCARPSALPCARAPGGRPHTPHRRSLQGVWGLGCGREGDLVTY